MRRLCVALVLVAGPAVASDDHPYVCWSIKDDVERLACFDMALGPPPAAGHDLDAIPGRGPEAGSTDRTPQPGASGRR